MTLWVYNKIVHPIINSEFIPNEDLRDDIKSDFLEAASVLNISPRAAAAILRFCVQKICVQIGEKGKNIDADIASLVKKGLDSTIQKALDAVRVIGNNAVHPGKIDLKDDKETVVTLFDLINFIADIMISREKKVSAFYEILPQTAKDQIEKRDGK